MPIEKPFHHRRASRPLPHQRPGVGGFGKQPEKWFQMRHGRLRLAATMTSMRESTHPELRLLAGLYLQNERSLVVHRCVQRFLAGEISSREAIARIPKHAGVRDEDPDRPPDS